MAYLKKRKRNYYVRYYTTENSKVKSITKSLGTRPKIISEDELKKLFKVFDEELER